MSRIVVSYLKLRWLFLASVLVGIIEILAPRYVPTSDSVDSAYETTMAVALVYVILLIAAVMKHRWRGLLLAVLPIILYWPLAFVVIDYASRQNVNACP